jgi:hypothetical protein
MAIFDKAERHAAQALALRERNHPAKFCGSLFCCSAVRCSNLVKFHMRLTKPE